MDNSFEAMSIVIYTTLALGLMYALILCHLSWLEVKQHRKEIARLRAEVKKMNTPSQWPAEGGGRFFRNVWPGDSSSPNYEEVKP
jgi:hypothetical protein